MTQLLILNYHAILPDDSEEISDRFSLKLSQFLEQLNWIEKSQIPIVNLIAWQENHKSSNQLSIALTFDDGLDSHYELVILELLKRNIPATFFPIVSKIGQNGFLNWWQLQEMLEKGFEIGSHGFSHKRLIALSKTEWQKELVHSKELLERKLNHSPLLFSIPFGVYSPKTLRMLSLHYRLALTTASIVNTNDSSFLMHRFNCKNTQSLEQFQEVIHGNPFALRKRKMRSSLALRFNQFKAFFDSSTSQNQLL